MGTRPVRAYSKTSLPPVGAARLPAPAGAGSGSAPCGKKVFGQAHNCSGWLIAGVTSALMLGAMAAQHKSDASAPWSFGVMDDTQWTCSNDPAGNNPHQMAKSIIDQVDSQFIRAGVRFVIQVGDLTDTASDIATQARAEAAQPLLDAGEFAACDGASEFVGGRGRVGHRTSWWKQGPC